MLLHYKTHIFKGYVTSLTLHLQIKKSHVMSSPSLLNTKHPTRVCHVEIRKYDQMCFIYACLTTHVCYTSYFLYTRFFFYKNVHYKNGQKIKNIVRILKIMKIMKIINFFSFLSLNCFYNFLIHLLCTLHSCLIYSFVFYANT